MEGHTGATTEYPNGIYHHHCSNVNYMDSGFYVLKAGSYYGTKAHSLFKIVIFVIAVLTTIIKEEDEGLLRLYSVTVTAIQKTLF
jgi:hypothetical protein